MSRDGVTAGGTAGQKRPADEGFDPVNSPIDVKHKDPYDYTREQTTHSVVQSKEWEAYKGFEKQIKQLLTEPPSKADYQDNFIDGVVGVVNECLGDRKSQPIVLCFMGPMGMGKSATLNSLFGVGQIAREGDLGGSCTLASCIYRSRKPGQEAPFLAEVTFFNPQERREVLGDWLALYFHANHQQSDEDEAEPGNQQSVEDLEANLDIRNEVITAFVSLFGAQPECRTKQDVRAFLDGAKSPRDPVILGKLHSWCDSVVTRATDGKPAVTISASTASELGRALEDFTTYAEDDSGNLTTCVTPMVSLITFYFDDPLTRAGIEFLDTPGTSDSNRARKKSANKCRKYLTHCAILSDEARVKDDAAISKAVRNMRNRGPGKTIIVITRSDLLSDSAVPSGSKAQREERERLKKAVNKFERELNAIEIEFGDAAAGEDDKRTGQLARRKTELEVRVKWVANAEKAFRIRMRSESNKKALQEKLQDITLSPIPVLSISNTEYARHLEGYAAKNTPVLSVEQTNIPQLRRIISTFPNEARLNEMKHQQEVNIPALLKKIQLYTVRAPSDRKADMAELVLSPTERYAKRIVSILTNFETELNRVLDTMTAKEDAWRKSAGKLCDKWYKEFDNGKLLNLLKRDGQRRGNYKSREVNMSAELIDISSDDIAAIFSQVIPLIRDFKTYVVDDMDNLVADMIQNLKEDSNEPFMALGAFYDYVHAEKQRIPGHIKSAFEALFRGIDDIGQRATSDDADAFLVEAMLPIYAHVRLLKGGKDQTEKAPKGGWPKHRRVVIRQELTRLDGIWSAMRAKIASEISELLRVQSERLLATVGKTFNDMHTSFMQMCEVKDTGDPEERRVQDELKINVEKAEEILRGPMQQAYEALERDFRRVGVTD